MKSRALSMFATALMVCCLFACMAHGQSTTVRYEDVVRNTRGDVIGGATISVYTANTTTLVTIYSNVAGTTTKSNPLSSDTAGRFWFYATAGTYDIRVSGNGITTYTLEDVDLTGGAFAREATDPQLLYGDGAPTATAPVGSIYQRGDAVADSALYIQGPTDWYSVMMPVNRTGSEYAVFGDQTPDVSGTDFLIFSNHQATSVTNFDGGVDGQILSVYIADNYTALVAGGLSGGLFQSDDLFGAGTYCVYRFSVSSNSWFLMWSSNMANVASDYYLDNWDPYGIDATMPVLSDPQFWPGWDANAPRPLYNLVSGSCVASLDSTVVLDLDIVADEPVAVSTMYIVDGDTTIANFSGSYVTNPHRTITTGLACADGDTYVVNYKLANASGSQSPWWRGGTFTVVIEDYEPVVLANLVGTPTIIGSCSTTASLELDLYSDVSNSTANYCWTKVGSGDTSAVASDPGGGNFHIIEINTDSLCVNGSMFDVFVSLTNDNNDVTGPRHGPYRYTVSGLDETPPSQGQYTLTGQCSDSLVALQLSVTSAEPCYLSAQWRQGSTGTWNAVSGQTAFNVLHNVSIATNLACVNNQVFYVQYRLTDQFQNTSAWFSGGSYTVSVTPPPGDTMWPIINPAGCSVVASVVNGNTVLTITIDADETFSAYARAVSGTNTITFGVPQEAAGGLPVYADPCTRVINTGVAAVQGQTWIVSATMWDDEPSPNYTSPPYSNYVGTATVDMTPTFGPEITSASGNVTNGSAITISGTGFGVGGEIISWDDFDSGTIGSTLSDPVIGPTWTNNTSYPYSPYPQYSSSQAHSGTQSAKVAWKEQGFSGYSINAFGWSNQGPYKNLYLSWWRYHDPSNDDILDKNHKQAYVFGNANYNGYSDVNQWMPFMVPAGTSTWCAYFQNYPSSPNYSMGLSYSSTLRDWQRWEGYLQYESVVSANDGYMELWHDCVRRRQEFNLNVADTVLGEAGNACYDIRIGHMFQGYGTMDYVRSFFDDVYIATSRARVEIGNSPSFIGCTHREIQPFALWGTNSIVINAHQGSFASGENSYLFVVDDSGRASAGFPITWGGSVTPSDVIPPMITPESNSYTNVSWGNSGTDSLAVIVEFGTSEPAKVVGQILVTTINGDPAVGYQYEPADTTGNWSSTYSTVFRDTLFTEESWDDTIGYVSRFLMEDRAGNMSAWSNFGTSTFGEHVGTGTTSEPDSDTVYITFAYNPPANHPVIDNTVYEQTSGAIIEPDSTYYFLWAPRNQSGANPATSATASNYFGTFFEFGGWSDPMGANGLATTDTSFVTFAGVASARRLSNLGQYIQSAKYYFHVSPSEPTTNVYNFQPSPNYYAAAVCTSSVFFEAEAVAMGNPAPYNYLTNNISYASVGEGSWDANRTDFTQLSDYGIGVETQVQLIPSGADFSLSTWYSMDITSALQEYYGSGGVGNGHGIIIVHMGHAQGTTTLGYPDISAWRSSSNSGVYRPLITVKLVIPSTLRVPEGITVPTPSGIGKYPEIFGEGP